MTTTTTEKPQNHSITIGLVSGLIFLLLQIISLYLMSSFKGAFVSVIVGGILLIISIILYVYFVKDLRTKQGGTWGFLTAFAKILLMMIVASLITFSGNLLYTKVIDKNVMTNIENNTVSSTQAMMEKSNVPQEKIDETIEKIQTSFKEQTEVTPKALFLGFGKAMLFNLFLALIFAAVFKKSALKPLTPTES